MSFKKFALSCLSDIEVDKKPANTLQLQQQFRARLIKRFSDKLEENADVFVQDLIKVYEKKSGKTVPYEEYREALRAITCFHFS